MASKSLKQTIKGGIIQLANVLPFSSLTIGSPRRLSFVEKESFEKLILQQQVALVENPPGSIDKEVFFKFPPLYNRVQPRQYILKLQQARLWGNNGAVIDSNDRFIADVSKEFGPAKFDPSKHSVFNRVKLRKPEKFNGSIAVIASPGSNVYAHWFCDILPRIILLKKAGVLDKVDKILINYNKLDFQQESLALLSIPEEKLINCIDDLNFHLVADTVYVPSYPNEHGTVNPWVCNEVKALYKTIASDAQDFNHKRLYISRRKAVGRRLINEDVLIEYLEQEYGFVKVFTEDFTMAEKVNMFQQAECIVAPHGGGMTNILFCEAGCKVVDIFPPGDFDTFFWSISNSNKLEFYYFFGKGELPTPEKDFVKRNADIDIDMNRFKDLMNLLKLQKIR